MNRFLSSLVISLLRLACTLRSEQRGLGLIVEGPSSYMRCEELSYFLHLINLNIKITLSAYKEEGEKKTLTK